VEPVLAGAIVLVAGMILAFAVKKLTLGDGVTFLSLMLLPLLTYGVLSGKVKEFTAPGGWSAKFLEIADTSVDAVPIAAPISVSDATFVEKGGPNLLLQLASDMPAGKPIAVTLQLGLSHYVESAIRDYIQVLSAKDPEMSVLIIDGSGKYVASAKGTVLANLLGGPVGQRFMEALRQGSVGEILSISGFSDKSIAEGDTNINALQKMEAENTSRLVAVTSDRIPKGIVLRDMIVSRLLVGLASDKR
jgi:hypothetical protein